MRQTQEDYFCWRSCQTEPSYFYDCDLLHVIIVPAGASKAFRKALHFIDGDTDFLVIEVAGKKDDAKAQNDKKENVKAEDKKESKKSEDKKESKKAEEKKESKKSEDKKESKKTEEKKSEEKKVQMPSDKNKKEEKKKAKA